MDGQPDRGRSEQPDAELRVHSPGHRLFVVGPTTATSSSSAEDDGFSLYWESRTIGNASYTFPADANGDGGTANDLIYIPRDTRR